MTCGYSLSSVVAEICERAGMPLGGFDVSRLEGEVSGFFITNEDSAIEHIRALAQAHFFDPSGIGGAVHFVHRGGAVAMDIDESHIIGDGFDETVRRSPESIVQVLNLNYFDLNGGLDTDKQTSDRSIDVRSEGEESINSPLVMTADFAAQRAVIAHKVMIEDQRGTQKISLPDTYLGLTVADAVTLRGQRFRVVDVRLGDGEQDYTLAYDRKSAYQSNAIGIAPIPPLPPVSLVPGVTDLAVLDCPILIGPDDTQLGIYIAVSGESPAWAGALIEVSLDGGETYLESEAAEIPAVMGELITPLGNHSHWYPDAFNTCRVRLSTPVFGLDNITFTQQLNRLNRAIIGDEIVSFSSAVEIEPGVWELGGWLRGRLGTAPALHAAGSRFVLLERSSVAYRATEQFNLGQMLTFRATTFNSDETTVVSTTFTGASQRERAPGYLRARVSGGQLIIDWIGTGRLGGRGVVTMGQYFMGYRVSIDGALTDTQSNTLTVPYSGQSVVRVCQLNKFTGEGAWAQINL